MSAKFITTPRFAWTGILIVILLGLLFLPGIQKRAFHKTPANISTGGESSLPTKRATTPMTVDAGSTTPAPGTEQAGHTIIFRVIDAATGRGIEGASLHPGPRIDYGAEGIPLGGELITDTDGRCAISVMPPIAISVRADGYVSRRTEFRTGEDYPAEYTFKLVKGGTIGGYVRDDSGNAIRDAKVRIRARFIHALDPKPTDHESVNTSLVTQTDASGHWTCNEFRSDALSFEIRLTHPEYVQRDCWTDTSIASEDPITHQKIQPVAMDELKAGKAVLLMEYGLLVAGIVADENGKAIEGATVSQMAGIVTFSTVSTTSTTRDGRFAFTHARRGEMTLMVQAKGYAPDVRTIQVIPPMPDIEFRLGKGQIVRGRVIDDEGQPIVGAVLMTVPSILSPVPPFSWQDLWRDKTDMEGRFLWDSAPAQTLLYTVSAQGFKAPENFLALEPFKENEIILHRLRVMRISGKVVDAKTMMPIDKFTVAVRGRARLDTTSAEGRNGEFTVSLSEQESKYRFTIEAAGYLPDTSQSLDFKEGDWTLDIALTRGDGPAGIVKLPGGEPVAGANVFLCGGYTVNRSAAASPEKMPSAPSVGGLKNVRPGINGTLSNATTDESGRFTLAVVPDAHTVIATHEKGFAAVAVDQLTASGTLILEPWGRIEGTFQIGNKVGADQRVTLVSLVSSSPTPAFSVRMNAQTDAEGEFLFPMVPRGEYHVANTPFSSPIESQSTSTVVRSGETSSVKLGGMGCPLIGRVVVSGTDFPIDWRRASAGISLKMPTAPAPSPQDRSAYNAWLQSEERKNQMRSQRNYAFVVAPDGSFRVEDIPAGTYILRISVVIIDPSQPSVRSAPQIITKEFIILEMVGGRSDKPLDLGTLTMQITGKQ